MFGEVRPVHKLWVLCINSETSASILRPVHQFWELEPILRTGTKSVKTWETRLDLAALLYLASPALKYSNWVSGEIWLIPEIWYKLCKHALTVPCCPGLVKLKFSVNSFDYFWSPPLYCIGATYNVEYTMQRTFPVFGSEFTVYSFHVKCKLG